MRWTDPRRIAALALAAALAAAVFLPRLRSAEEKRISINVENGLYLIPVIDRSGHEYVDARELLQPLGEVSIRRRGAKVQLRTHGREIEFADGSGSYEVGGKRGGLTAPALLEGERLLLPTASLPSVLHAVLAARVDMDHASRRIFLGDAGIRFSAEVAREADNSVLRLRFSAPVNPTISTEPGKLRMTFRRDPVASGTEHFKFSDRLITGADFIETNGLAVLEIAGTAPLIAEFGEGGRQITVTAAPGPQITAAPPPASPAADPAAPAPDSPLAPLPVPAPDIPAAASGPTHARYLVVIDASHGGSERGAALSDDLAEKDVTLAFARRLRNELRERGVATLMMRDADLTIPLEHRAETVNVAHAAVYISIHASSPGPGVRIYTSMLAPAERSGPFLPWERAQGPYVNTSRKLVTEVAEALQQRRFQVGFMPAPVRPLNSVAAPAVALELSPPRPDVESILNSDFQAGLAQAVAAAVVRARPQLEAAR